MYKHNLILITVQKNGPKCTKNGFYSTRRATVSFSFFFSSRRRHTRCSRDWSSDVCSSDLKAAGILASRDMLQGDIAAKRAKQWDAGADEHRNTGDNEALNEASLQELLNSDPAIHIDMPDAAGLKLRHDLGWSPGHPLHHCPSRSGGDRTTTEHENGLLAVGPPIEAQDRLERLAADDQCVHRGNKLIIPVRFATAGREKIEGAVRTSDEAVEASANKDGCFHRPRSSCCRLTDRA